MISSSSLPLGVGGYTHIRSFSSPTPFLPLHSRSLKHRYEQTTPLPPSFTFPLDEPFQHIPGFTFDLLFHFYHSLFLRAFIFPVLEGSMLTQLKNVPLSAFRTCVPCISISFSNFIIDIKFLVFCRNNG